MIGWFTSPIVSLVTNQNTAATRACSKRRENKVYTVLLFILIILFNSAWLTLSLGKMYSCVLSQIAFKDIWLPLQNIFVHTNKHQGTHRVPRTTWHNYLTLSLVKHESSTTPFFRSVYQSAKLYKLALWMWTLLVSWVAMSWVAMSWALTDCFNKITCLFMLTH